MDNTNAALTIDTNGKTYLYGSHLTCGCVPRFTVKLSRNIDEGALKEAVSVTLKRFPQMAVGIGRDRYHYYFVPLASPSPVFHNCGGTVRNMGTEDTNGYLFCISYNSKEIFFDFFHALGDGIGFLMFIKSVLYHYLEQLGLPVENDGSIRTKETAFSACEAEDAVLKIEPDGRAEYPRFPAYRVPNITTEDDPADTVVQIRLPFSDLRGITKQYQASPVTFICPLFSHALYEQYCADTPYEKPIIAAIPVNMRPYFPSETTRNFISCAGIPYDKKMCDLRFDQILNISKGLLDFQTQAHELAHDAKKNALDTLALLDAEISVEEKHAIMNRSITAASSQTTYIITNMGNLSLPACMEEHIKEIYPCLPTAQNPFTMALLSYRGELVINVAQRFADTSVCQRFVQLMNKAGIPAHITRVYPLHTMRYNG